MNQERKNELAPAIKNVFKKYGVKATIAVRHHSTLCVTIQESKFDVESHVQVNHFYIDDHYSGECADFLNELKDAMMNGNHDRSDLMTD